MKTLPRLIERLCSPLQPQPTGYPTRLTPLSDIRAVVFDIYGTLLISGSGDVGPDSADDDEQAFRTALVDAGIDSGSTFDRIGGAELLRSGIIAAQAERREQQIAYPEIDILAVWRGLFAERGLTTVTTAQLQAVALAYECRVNPVWPMPQLRATLDAIRALGLPMGIVSNAQFYTPLLIEALTDSTIDQLGFDPALCVWSWRELEGKPSQTLFRQLLRPLEQRYHIGPQQTLYIGNDCLKDIWTASSLGLRTALFAGDQRSLRLRADDPRCAPLRPDIVIDQLDQLPGLLDVGATGPGPD